MFINHWQSDWAEWLACAEFSYNNNIQSSTGFSPFYINYGRHPYKGTNPRWEANSQSAIEFVEHIKKVHEETEAALKQSNETMKRAYDKRGELWEYKPGDRVYLEGTNITTDQPIKKLDDKWHGPFTVIKKVGATSYKLKLPMTWSTSHPSPPKITHHKDTHHHPHLSSLTMEKNTSLKKSWTPSFQEGSSITLSNGKGTWTGQNGPGNPKKVSLPITGWNSMRNTRVRHGASIFMEWTLNLYQDLSQITGKQRWLGWMES